MRLRRGKRLEDNRKTIVTTRRNRKRTGCVRDVLISPEEEEEDGRKSGAAGDLLPAAAQCKLTL